MTEPGGRGKPERDYEARRLRERPAKDDVATLAAVSTAVVSDVLAELRVKNFRMRGIERLRPFRDGPTRMAGPAITMQFAPTTGAHHFTEAPYVHIEIVDQAEAGDVIIMAAGGSEYAYWGDQMTGRAIRDGLAGAVVDGRIRDSGTIRQTDFPVFGTGVTFEAFVPYAEPVAYNTPVPCGGAVVSAGDMVVGDDDGVLVVPSAFVPSVVRGVRIMKDLEEWITQAKAEGLPTGRIYDRVGEVAKEIASLRD